MAAIGDYFSTGSMVSCTTCFKQSVEGEVLAFDPMTKMLILKCTAGSNSTKLNDIFVVNLEFCSDVQVKEEVKKEPDVPDAKIPPPLNIQRLSTRVRNAQEQKKRWISARTAGVSVDGQKLYMAISKTIKHIAWRGPNIIVFNDVTIKPPYKLEDVNGNPESRQLTYVKKIVEKFIADQEETNNTTITTTTTTTETTTNTIANTATTTTSTTT
ncbi:protein LSM12 homolog A [Contarinia nasturtii]|uniref:protein LSM12 homolog A n=1 Tax=Contarinia nasturtii TaxID=265458 RepID=UPI0012D3895A|nr:protein LSM12 homolog A [Contarinia nasturtii]